MHEPLPAPGLERVCQAFGFVVARDLDNALKANPTMDYIAFFTACGRNLIRTLQTLPTEDFEEPALGEQIVPDDLDFSA